MPMGSHILGVDLGTKIVGLAIADWELKIATGLDTVQYQGQKKFIEQLRSIIADNNIGLVVIGHPFNMNGSEGRKAKEARKIAGLIKNELNIDTQLADERLTTAQAINELHAGNGKVGKSREKINMMAAIFILQGFLDSLPSGR